MRLLILSDLHQELWGNNAPCIDLSISRPDIVVLAGDINTGSKAVEWAAQTFSDLPVLYVHGNHEGYGCNLDMLQSEIREACSTRHNVHFLQCDEIIIDEIRFLGATLWSDFRLFGDDSRRAAMYEAEATMNDYKRIRLASKGYKKLRATDTEFFHTEQRSWLQRKLSTPFTGKTVVITHMAPSVLSVSEKYATDLVTAAYASNIDYLVEHANLWIHGHMHESLDYKIGRGRVVCNPCGYWTRGKGPENPQFDPNFVVTI